VAPTTISHIERSNFNPSPLMLHKVARALDTNVPQLLNDG
jgi:transcriptional regulator with XRE-family HTH domain